MTIQKYICEVDLYRNGKLFRKAKDKLYSRQTEGVYIVGAKSPKEAKKILQKAIRFGSITIPKHGGIATNPAIPELRRGDILKSTGSWETRKGIRIYINRYEPCFPSATDPAEKEAASI